MKLHVNYISRALQRDIDLDIVIPTPQYGEIMDQNSNYPSYMPDFKYPVVYMLHGTGNNCRNWLSYTQAELFAEERAIAMVGVGGENKKYADCGADRFEQLIQKELPELICGNFPISSRPQDTYICGLSMGGYGAMLNFLKAPKKFGAIGCFSGAFDHYPQLAQNPEYNLHELLKKAMKAGKLPPMYIACGAKDFILDNSLSFKKSLDECGAEHTFVLDENFSHEWRFWNIQLEKFLDWLPRTDGYAGTFKKL